jgi:hypothetical protein
MLKRKDKPGGTCIKWENNIKSDLKGLRLESEE